MESTMPAESMGEITYQDKVRIFSHDYLKCCVYISQARDQRLIFTKKLYSKLISTTQLMEDFLDFHGAKNNTDWFYYRELRPRPGISVWGLIPRSISPTGWSFTIFRMPTPLPFKARRLWSF